jgi:hypothetical protein
LLLIKLLHFQAEIYVAVQDYDATNSDELSIRRGYCVEVLEKNYNGYWCVKLKYKSKGLVPAVCLKKSYIQNPNLRLGSVTHDSREADLPEKISQTVSAKKEAQVELPLPNYKREENKAEPSNEKQSKTEISISEVKQPETKAPELAQTNKQKVFMYAMHSFEDSEGIRFREGLKLQVELIFLS